MALETRNPTAGDGGARNVVVHGGSTDFQNNLNAQALQVATLCRHYFITPHLASVIAELAFPNPRRATT